MPFLEHSVAQSACSDLLGNQPSLLHTGWLLTLKYDCLYSYDPNGPSNVFDEVHPQFLYLLFVGTLKKPFELRSWLDESIDHSFAG